MPSKRKKMSNSIIKSEASGLSNIVPAQFFRTCTHVWLNPPFQAQDSEFLICPVVVRQGWRGRHRPCSRWIPQTSEVLISKIWTIQAEYFIHISVQPLEEANLAVQWPHRTWTPWSCASSFTSAQTAPQVVLPHQKPVQLPFYSLSLQAHPELMLSFNKMENSTD